MTDASGHLARHEPAKAMGGTDEEPPDGLPLEIPREAVRRMVFCLERVRRAPLQMVGGTNLVSLSDEWFDLRRGAFDELWRETDPFDTSRRAK